LEDVDPQVSLIFEPTEMNRFTLDPFEPAGLVFRRLQLDENHDPCSGCIKDNSISLGFLTFDEHEDPLGNSDKSPVSMNRLKSATDNAYSRPFILSKIIPIARVELPNAVLTETSALVIQ
jgi:hypothetical protein